MSYNKNCALAVTDLVYKLGKNFFIILDETRVYINTDNKEH